MVRFFRGFDSLIPHIITAKIGQSSIITSSMLHFKLLV